jgi:hypothetical protein
MLTTLMLSFPTFYIAFGEKLKKVFKNHYVEPGVAQALP